MINAQLAELSQRPGVRGHGVLPGGPDRLLARAGRHPRAGAPPREGPRRRPRGRRGRAGRRGRPRRGAGVRRPRGRRRADADRPPGPRDARVVVGRVRHHRPRARLARRQARPGRRRADGRPRSCCTWAPWWPARPRPSGVPWGNMYEFTVVGSLAITGAWLVLQWRRDVRWLGLYVDMAVLLSLGLAVTVLYTESAQLVPALQVVLAGHPRLGGDRLLGGLRDRRGAVGAVPGQGARRGRAARRRR